MSKMVRINNVSHRLAFLLILPLFTFNCGSKEITRFSKDGKTIQEKYYVNKLTKKIEGTYFMYNREGVLMSSTQFKKGIENGLSITYCSDGVQIKESSTLVNGKFDGLTKGYYCNGNPKYSVLYKSNRIIKVFDLNTISGDSLFAGDHENGTGVILKYNDKGDLISKISIVNGLKQGFTYNISNTGHVDSILYNEGKSKDDVADLGIDCFY